MKFLKNFSCFCIAILVFVSCTKASKTLDRVGVVERGDIVQQVSVSGSLRGKRSSYIYPGYAGYVFGIQVKLGSKVKEGSPLVRITQTLDQPLSEVFPIRAPFSGVVTQVLKKEGENVTVKESLDNAILRLDDLSEYWMDVDIPEIDVAKIHIGLEAKVRPNALTNQVYTGEIREIALSAKTSEDRWDRGKVEFPVRIFIKDPDEKLKPGMSAVGDIITAKAEKTLRVPLEFIDNDNGKYFVTDLQGKSHEVTLGLRNETYAEVLSGVPEGIQLKMVDFKEAAKGGGKRSGRPSH